MGTGPGTVPPTAVDHGGRRAPRLFAESFAPLCEKARWALDHHGVAYRWHEHVPLDGAFMLRLAARRWRGRVTVPLLVGDGLVLMDSFDIGRHAQAVVGIALPARPAGGIGVDPEPKPAEAGWYRLAAQLTDCGLAGAPLSHRQRGGEDEHRH